MQLLKGKSAIVTGATAGIGKEIARHFVQQGANVAIFGTNPERAESVLKELQGLSQDPSQKISAHLVDVSKFEDVIKTIDAILLDFGNVDILVNNAGITKDCLLMKMTEADWDAVLDTNLKSVFNTCKALARSMMKARSGAIINISSVIGLTGNAGQINYAASKAGMIGFTKSIAKELSSRGVRANCIAPGYIETSMTEVLSPEIKQKILEKIPLGRIGKPEDVAKLAVFLASDWANYITGQTLTVDGGMVM